MKLRQGNSFTRICYSVHRGVCPIACWDIPTTPVPKAHTPQTKSKHPPDQKQIPPTKSRQPPGPKTETLPTPHPPPPGDQKQSPPPSKQTPPRRKGDTPPDQRQTLPRTKRRHPPGTVNKRPVRILLKCILVIFTFNNWYWYFSYFPLAIFRTIQSCTVN